MFSGQALTEDGKIRAKKSDGSPARESVENLVSAWKWLLTGKE